MLTLYIADAEKDVSMKNLSRKEAITILEGMRIDIPVPKAAITQIKRNLALDMAIEALSCSEFPNNSDTISRQQAIDALNMQAEEMSHWSERYQEQRRGVLTAVNIIVDCPSVQPERKKGHWIPVTNGRGGHKCDRCGSYAPSYQSGTEWLSNFCPECNADMRGDQE